jgi:hypothetical protein
VLDAAGTLVRRLTSAVTPPVPEAATPPEPSFWIAPPTSLPATAGINRANWDLRYDPPPAFSHSFEINANPYLTPTSPEGPLVKPGTYTVRLTVDGTSSTSSITVTEDPRMHVTAAALAAQLEVQLKAWRGMQTTWDGTEQAKGLRGAIAADTASSVAPDISARARGLLARIDSVAGADRSTAISNPFFRRGGPPTFLSLNGSLAGVLNAQDNADMAPTEAMLAGFDATCRQLGTAVTSWNAIRNHDVAGLNEMLSSHQMAPVTVTGSDLAAPPCGMPGRTVAHGRAGAASPAAAPRTNEAAETEDCDEDDFDCGNP